MRHKIKLLLFSFSIVFSGCTVTRVSSRSDQVPTKSFVKILHTTKVEECSTTTCPRGSYAQTGSGMAVSLFKNEMTVLTAGHVCDSQPADFITKAAQTILVVDYNDKKHQAWPIHVSFDNEVGSGDLCLLWVPTLEVKKVKFSLWGPKIGDQLTYVGAPLGIHHPPTVPIFKGTYSGKISASAAIVTFPAIGGSSGSAVLNSNNRIVGVVFAANVAFHHVSVITTYESLKVFLNQAKSKFKN